MFLIMSQVTATITTPSVTVVCSKASPISMTVTKAATFVGLAAMGQDDVFFSATTVDPN